MKLKNKKTGEIKDWSFAMLQNVMQSTERKHYGSLAELNAEWEDAPEEEWRDVLGFEELYQVSNLGKVRTIKNGEAEMSQQENRNGYMTVHLRNKGVERRAMVHRLVAEAFISNPDELRDVNHKNGDKSDNRVENLEWASHSDNMTHSFRELGKNVRHIVQLSLDGVLIDRWNSITEAAEATGICRTDIGACCRGERTMAGAFDWKYEEDYEEPKEYWYIDWNGEVCRSDIHDERTKRMKQIGNYFETKEEAEKAVRKLKAWKRLKDREFDFIELRAPNYGGNSDIITIKARCPWNSKNIDDLRICFGGEE